MAKPKTPTLPRNVISFGPPKEAALYFDRVLPFDMAIGLLAKLPFFSKIFSEASANSIPLIDGKFDSQVIHSLLGEHGEEVYKKHAGVTMSYLMMSLFSQMRSRIGAEKTLELSSKFAELFKGSGFSDSDINDIITKQDISAEEIVLGYDKPLVDWLEVSGFKDADQWFPDFSIGGERFTVRNEVSSGTLAALCIRDLDLVDVNKISWDQVLEFRKDKKSRSALSNLRVFFEQNYAGMSREEIYDRLQVTLYEYDVARKAWGFEAARKSFAAAVSQQGLITSSIGTLSAALLGAPAATVTAVGATVALGSCVMEFGQIAIDHWKAESTRPTRYLTELKKLGRR